MKWKVDDFFINGFFITTAIALGIAAILVWL